MRTESPDNTQARLNEPLITLALANTLVKSQFPEWADLPITPVKSSGTDNTLFRLGKEMVIRMPFRESAILPHNKEVQCLPKLAANLSINVPQLLAVGSPENDYPWDWSIYGWLEGSDGWTKPIQDLQQAAIDLGEFVTELHRIDPGDGPRPGQHNQFRGIHLARLDSRVRSAVDELGDRVNQSAVIKLWHRALDQPKCTQFCWIHADLQPGNLLNQNDRLVAVIDFGLLGVGDPACDLLPAWNLFTAETRTVFRNIVEVDDATWIRGQGWALYQALIALPYYWDTNPVMVQMSQGIINEALMNPIDQ